MNAQLQKMLVKLLYVVLGVKLAGWIFFSPLLWVQILIACVIVLVLILWDR